MIKTQAPYLWRAIALLTGIFWVHIDYLVVIIAFAGIILIPLLGLIFVLYLIIFIGGFVNNRAQSKREGLTGLAVIVILVGSPFLSTWVVDKFYKYHGEVLIEQLEQYRKRKGRYPVNVAELDNVKKSMLPAYFYHSQTDHYSIRFRNGWMITTKFDSRTREWANYDWND